MCIFYCHKFTTVLATFGIHRDSENAETSSSSVPLGTIVRNENNVHGMVGHPSVHLIGVFQNVRRWSALPRYRNSCSCLIFAVGKRVSRRT